MEKGKLIFSPLEDEGKWFEIAEGFALKLRCTSYRPYRQAMALALRENKSAMVRGTYSVEQQDETQARLFADHVVVGWRGLTENGKEVPFSIDGCFKLMKDGRRLLRIVEMIATQEEQFRIEEDSAEIEAGKKN